MVVIGLGSPFLSDDSIGPRVVRRLGEQGLSGVRLVEAHAGGLLLLEELQGVQRAVIIDALLDERKTVGEIYLASLDGTTRNASCGHDCSLPETLAIGRALGMELPEDRNIHLVAIVARDVATFSEQLTPAVEAALDDACDLVWRLLEPIQGEGSRCHDFVLHKDTIAL